MNDGLVYVDNVSKLFAPNAPPSLDNISVTIPKGKMIGLAGPDGAGKTTLLRLIAGLLKPSSGTIRVKGYDTIKDPEPIHEILGYMPQKFGLYEDLTVQQNLNLYADLRGVLGQEREEKFKQLLKFTSLAPFTDRLAKALSGGMKQKLGLACSLIQDPELLLLDEPSVGVDPLSRRELWKMVENLLHEGITVVWSTSYLDEAEKCDSVILLNEGKLLFSGPPKELTKRVEGRTYIVCQIQGNRREYLEKALCEDDVVDGVIQGKDVRLVLVKPRDDAEISRLKTLNNEKELEIDPVAPRFEDAFIDLLGGGPGGISELAEQSPAVPKKDKPVVEADHLTKKFGSFTASNNITFAIQCGEIFGLLGPNGAGKTTTFKMMCGLLKPTSGNAYVNGLDLQKAPGRARSHIGYMAQKFSLYGNLSVGQNLHFFAGIYNLQGKEKQNAIDEMLDIFNLKPFYNEPSESLPLGFKQRLSLSCAVMHHPDVLFLDEPTSGVDPITRREFWTHINGLVEKGVTVMVTTHFMDEAEYCDRIGLVYRSKMITMGTPDSLKEHAATKENPYPTLEDAFIQLIEKYDQENNG